MVGLNTPKDLSQLGIDKFFKLLQIKKEKQISSSSLSYSPLDHTTLCTCSEPRHADLQALQRGLPVLWLPVCSDLLDPQQEIRRGRWVTLRGHLWWAVAPPEGHYFSHGGQLCKTLIPSGFC